MMRSAAMNRFAAALAGLAVLLLAACETPKGPTYPEIRFTDAAPIAFQAGSLDVTSTWRSPLADPNVEHRFPVSIEQTARNWANDRLKAAGGAAGMRYTVIEASAVEEGLKKTTGIKGAFTTDQTERYTAKITVKLEVFNNATGTAGEAMVTVERFQTVAEDYTVNQRNQIWYDLTRDLAKDLDAKMEAEIRKNLGQFLM
jgi:hypothetical protein